MSKIPNPGHGYIGTDKKLRLPKNTQYRYEVEKIEKFQWINKSTRDIEYYVVWKNIKGVKKYKKTWESRCNLDNCPKILNAFDKKHGIKMALPKTYIPKDKTAIPDLDIDKLVWLRD